MGVVIVERKYECTNGVIEKTRFPVGANTKRLPGKRYGKSSVKKQAENDRQAAKRLARILNCNFTHGDLFVTLRYSDDGLLALSSDDGKTFDAAKKNVQLFLRRLKRKYPDIKYVYVTSDVDGSTGELKRVHHHLVLPASCQIDDIEKAWKKYGDADVRKLRNQNDYTSIAVYLVRQGSSTPHAQKYSTSKNMIQPKITERIVSDYHEIKVNPRDSVLERSSYDPALSLVQYVRYKHYPRNARKPPDEVSGNGGDKDHAD